MLNGHSAFASKGEISPSAKPRDRKERGEDEEEERRRDLTLKRSHGEEKKKSPSEGLAEKLLLGWTMLGDTCPQCSQVPLMRDRENRLFCVACETFLSPPSLTSSSNSPPEPHGGPSTHPLVSPQYRLGASIPLDQADDNRLESTAERLTRRTAPIGEEEERSRRRVPGEERREEEEEEERDVYERRMLERRQREEKKEDQSQQGHHASVRKGEEEEAIRQNDLSGESGGYRHISSELIHWRERVLNHQQKVFASRIPSVSPPCSLPPLPACSTSATPPNSSSSSSLRSKHNTSSSSSSLRLIDGGQKSRGGEGEGVFSSFSSSLPQSRSRVLHAAEVAVLRRIERYTAMLTKNELSLSSSLRDEGEAKERSRTRWLADGQEEEEERADEPLDVERDREILSSLQTAIQVLSSLDTLKRFSKSKD